MSQKFTIAWVGDDVREWAPKNAPSEKNFAYEVRFEGDDRVVEWSRKASTDAPKVGEVTPPGDITNGSHGPKFSINWQQVKEEKGGGAGGRSGGSKREWKPESAYDPEKVARITRSHAQEMAVRVLVATEGFSSAYPKEKRQDALRSWTDFFELDVEEAAAQKAATGAGVRNANEGGLPADSPGPAQSHDEEPLPF